MTDFESINMEKCPLCENPLEFMEIRCKECKAHKCMAIECRRNWTKNEKYCDKKHENQCEVLLKQGRCPNPVFSKGNEANGIKNTCMDCKKNTICSKIVCERTTEYQANYCSECLASGCGFNTCVVCGHRNNTYNTICTRCSLKQLLIVRAADNAKPKLNIQGTIISL